MFAYCGNNSIVNIDHQGNYYTSYENRITIGHGGGGDAIYPPKSKRVDITNKLDAAFENNAKAFRDYINTYGYALATAYFIRNVRSGGIWDLKHKWNLDPETAYVYKGVAFSYDDIGNIHYGYVSRVLFSKDFALTMAGMYQILSGTSSIYFRKTNYDDPSDQRAIRIGFRLWDERNV